MNKRGYAVLFICMLIGLAGPIFAQTETEDEAGVTPDSALWGLDKAFEQLNLLLTFDKATRTEIELEHASERLAEARVMIKDNKVSDAELAEEEHKRTIEHIKLEVQKENNSSEDRIRFEEQIKNQETESSAFDVRVKIESKGFELTEEQLSLIKAFVASFGAIKELELKIESENGEHFSVKLKTRLSEDFNEDDDEVEVEVEKEDDADEELDDEDDDASEELEVEEENEVEDNPSNQTNTTNRTSA